MHLHRLIAIIRRLLGRERAYARCPASTRRCGRLLAYMLCTMLVSRFAAASVLVTGDVTPADNPFTTGINEGLPPDGNFINPFEDPDKQTYFEGRHLDNVISDLTDDTNQLINPISVGNSAFGALLISGESALRDGDLIIGTNGLRGGINRAGTGIVRITGFGSLYNNDPTIIPPGLPANFASKTPRPTDVGYDLIIGTQSISGLQNPSGTGTLEISAGARAEIQDAVIVGNTVGSTGSIIVDGFDSFLGSGGFQTSAVGSTEVHYLAVGLQGVGFMTITTGGTVRNDSTPTGAGSSNVGPVGAVIGGASFADTLGQVPNPGGVGTVTVNGTASKWIVGGSLQVGGFDIGATGVLVGDTEGDNVQYSNAAGRGTLYVQAGGLVNVVNAINADPDQPDLLLAVGRFGRIQMDGGIINIGGSSDPTTQGGNDNARSDTVQLINDGIIGGTGHIYTGVFNNRYFGEVRVDAGQTLVIDSSSDFVGATAAQPLTNFGVMQVFGTVEQKAELEFDRAPSTTTAPIQPFHNFRVARPATAPVTDFYGGLISAQHSILRFRSNLINDGMMAFTAGNNYVQGTVVNSAAPVISPTDPGIIVVSGPGTKVTFENDLINAGTLTISGGATVEILARHSFVTAGNLKMTITPSNANQIFSAGDAGIAGKLSLSLAGFSAGSLHVGDAFPILTVGGTLGGVDFTDPIYLKPDLAAAPLFSLVSFPNLVSLGLPATTALVPFYTSNSIYVSVVSFAAATGPDFNGDGVVNNADLNIWLANVGITSGASVVQGDADGDGDVDGDDFLFWQRNAGKPMPWTGAGSGSGAGSGAAVPEPAAVLLLLSSAFSLLGIRRRRSV